MTQGKEIATTIMQQLGGMKFIAMTGAKNFVHDKDGTLTFAIPRSKGINRVKIKLAWDDTYTVTFFYVHGAKVTEKHVQEGVYFNELQTLFTQQTGLYTKLF